MSQVGTMYRVDVFGKNGLVRSMFEDRQLAIRYAQTHIKDSGVSYVVVLDRYEKLIYQEKANGQK